MGKDSGRSGKGKEPVDCSWAADREEIWRHLSSIDIDLDNYELEVESIHPLKGLEYGEFSSSISRKIDLNEFPEIKNAVEKLVRSIKKVFLEPDPEYKPSRCDRCVKSDCCEFERIFLTREEAKKILDHIGEPWSGWRKFFVREKDLAEYYDFVFKRENGRCIFLKKRKDMMRCSIYPVRPRICREFDASTCDVWTRMKGKAKQQGVE